MQLRTTHKHLGMAPVVPLSHCYSPALRPSVVHRPALASSPNRPSLARAPRTTNTPLAVVSTRSVASFRTTHEEVVAAVAVHLVIPPRPPPTLPSPVPVLHSSAFLQAAVSGSYDEAASSSTASSGEFGALVPSHGAEASASVPQQRFEGNALEWALSKVDRSLDEIEHHPLPLQQRIYEISRGPAAEATGRGLQAAAEVTLKAGVHAVRAAAPVGAWALREGAKAASGLLQFTLLEAAKARERERQQQQQGGKKQR